MKNFCVLLISSVAATALAHHILTVGSGGNGRATSHSGRIGAFQYSASKKTEPHHAPVLAGSLRFEEHSTHAGHWALIAMGKPATVGVNGRICQFGGHGSLTRKVNGHNVTVHGAITVNVNDRRDAHHPHNDPDVFRITFNNGHGVTYSFDGLVNYGDLWVYTRVSH